MELQTVRELEEAYAVEVLGKPMLLLLWRLVNGTSMWRRDIEEGTTA